jgi:hypothetical protein
MPEDDAQRAGHFRDLRWSLRRLALAGLDQPSLFSDREMNADELAVDFDRHASLVRATYGSDLSQAQTEALAAIERKLETMSRDGAEFDLELWTDAALRTSEHWSEVRRLAAAALEAFGWDVEHTTEQGTTFMP